MPVNIIVDPPKSTRPEGAIRCDVAWKLFMPDFMGDLPPGAGSAVTAFNNWLWSELGKRQGHLRESEETTWILTPPLTEPALDYILRICSIWSNTVYVIKSENGAVNLESKGENQWKAPIYNLHDGQKDSPVFSRATISDKDGTTTFISPLLGSTKSFMRLYTIQPGNTYARMHSHTAREEMYMVLNGKGSVRYGKHKIDLREGDLVSKPLGPDVSSQLLADKGETLRILDIEIWPDPTRGSKDLVHYPDHGELDLFGPGWDLMIPDENIQPFGDAMENYSSGYHRNKDGSWTPKDVPGLKTREKKS